MLALLDGDILCYRCASSAEKEDKEFIAIARLNDLFESILAETRATEWKSFITGPNNFRREIYQAYKANRKQPPPKWLEVCERFLIEEWGAIVTDGCETDDYLGIELTRNNGAVVCTIDHDLLQVPGNHYNFVRKSWCKVEANRGIRTFYEQLLIGDSGDNVPGCKGIGKAKAPRILEGCEGEQEMFDCVRGCYNNDAEMSLNGKLLWVWRTYGGVWPKAQQLIPPSNIKQEAEAL